MDEVSARSQRGHPSPCPANLDLLPQFSGLSALAEPRWAKAEVDLCSLGGSLGGRVLGNIPQCTHAGKQVPQVTLTNATPSLSNTKDM